MILLKKAEINLVMYLKEKYQVTKIFALKPKEFYEFIRSINKEISRFL